MAESIRDPNINSFPQFIKAADVSELKQRLASWGIDDAMIGEDINMSTLHAPGV